MSQRRHRLGLLPVLPHPHPFDFVTPADPKPKLGTPQKRHTPDLPPQLPQPRPADFNSPPPKRLFETPLTPKPSQSQHYLTSVPVNVDTVEGFGTWLPIPLEPRIFETTRKRQPN